MCICCSYWIRQKPAVVEPEPEKLPEPEVSRPVPTFGICHLAACVAILMVICSCFGGACGA